MSFSKEQAEALIQPLDRKHVKSRSGGGNRQLSYIEGWHAIAEANRIFGFGGWTSETLHMECVCMEGTISYIAKVRVTIGSISREGWGAGHGRGGSVGDKHESAVKEAETDARKRALMTFGNQFGLALYDKEQANVEDGSTAKPEPSAEYKRQVATKAEMDKDPLFRWTHRIAQLTAATNWAEVEVHIRQSKDFNDEQREQLLKKLAEAKARAAEFTNPKS
jgi:DNA recombination protein Rad52|tara:strand:+ start:39 stop:701 length:663 start_codon:yes stop_codon:yes gene_type:complete